MEAFQQSVDWSSPDVTEQVNRLAKKLALEAITRYQQGGNEALGTYRDKAHPSIVADTFRSLLSRSKALPVYLPELNHYLLDYPTAPSEHIQSKFYWEKVNFGLKPTIRVVQAIIYRDVGTAGPAYAIAVKQLYASHYFETALDLTFCVSDPELEGKLGAESRRGQNACLARTSTRNNQTETRSPDRLTRQRIVHYRCWIAAQ
jgi:hypothetical protein